MEETKTFKDKRGEGGGKRDGGEREEKGGGSGEGMYFIHCMIDN